MNRVLDEEPNLSLLPDVEWLTAVFTKLLVKEPTNRYQSAQGVLHDLAHMGEITISETAVIRESYLQAATFVGRDTEMSQLKKALSQSQSEGCAVWLVGGESGVGKSRLLEELRAHALVSGWHVHIGQTEADGGVPYQLWQNIIPRLVLRAQLSELELGVLCQIAPDVALLFEHDIPEPPPLGGAETRQRLLLTLTTLLQQQTEPTLLFLEDLQWAHESLAPIKHILKASAQLSRLMVIGTYRLDERPDLPMELAGVHQLTLNRLSEEEITQLSEAMLGEQASSPQITSLLTQETEGNTFFIVEVMRALAEEVGNLDDIGAMTLPTEVFTSGMQQLLQRRIQRMPAVDQPLLQLAAVIGRQLDVALLQALAPEKDIAQWLQHATDTAVLTVRENQWLFAHDKLREAILSDLDAETLQSLHQSIAGTLETIYPNNKSYFEALLDHWHGAKHVDNEIHYLNLVAEELIDISGEHDHARSLLERGLSTLPANDPRHISLWNRLGQSYWRQGQHDRALDIHQQALTLALDVKDTTGEAAAYSNLGLIAFYQGEYAAARDYYQKSMTLNEAAGDRRMLDYNFNNLGNLEAATGNLEQATVYLQKCLEYRQQLNNEYLLGTTLNNLGNVATFQKDYVQARSYYEQGLAIQKRIGNVFSVAMSLNNLGNIAFYQADYEKSIEYLKESVAIYRQIGEPYGVTMCLINLGFAYVKRNDNQARDAFLEALAFAHSVKATPFITELIVGFACLSLQQERPIRAAELAGLAQLYQEDNIDVKIRLDDLMPLLNHVLDSEVIEIALENGKQLDLDATVQELLSG